MEKVKQYDFITLTYDEDENGVKTIKKMRFFGSSKHEFKVDGGIELEDNSDGKINTFSEIMKFLEGLPEGSNLKQIIDGIDTTGLTEEERAALDLLVNGEEVSEEELEQGWEEAMNNAMNGGTQDAGSGSGGVSGDGGDLDE